MDTLCNLGGRNFYKYNNEEAYVGIGYFTGSTGIAYMAPLLVGPTESSVIYLTDHNMQPCPFSVSFTYNGKKYYVSSTGQWMPTTNCTTNRVMFNTESTRYADMEAAGRALLDRIFK